MPVYETFTTTTQIRLLTLLQGHGDEILRAELQTRDLKSSPWFNAVSYTWGDPNGPRHTIVINGSRFQVWHNLWCFLVKLRGLSDHYLNRPIWIDTLCIDQLNSEEKGHQIQLISTIFQQAIRVLAWVGEHSDDSEILFKPHPLHTSQRASLSNRERSAWSLFLRRAYWTRTWIVQEFAMSNNIRMYCGNDSREWEDMIFEFRELQPSDNISVSAAQIINTRAQSVRGVYQPGEWRLEPTGGPFFALHNALPYALPVPSQRQVQDPSTYPQGNQDIFELMRRFANTECYDARDRVYALMALEKPSSVPLKWVIDASTAYKVAPYRVFVDVCVARFGSQWQLRQHTSDANVKDIMALFEGLRLDRTDAEKIIDFLVSELVKDKAKLSRSCFRAIVGAFDSQGLLTASKGQPCDIFGGIDPQSMPIELVLQGVLLLRSRRRYMQKQRFGWAPLPLVSQVMRGHFLGKE